MANTKTGAKRPARRNVGHKEISPMVAELVNEAQELCEAVDAGIPIHQKLRVTYYTFDFKTPEYGPADVKRVRESLLMSQANFATFLGVDTATVQSWEQGTRNPSGTAKRLMQEVEADRKYWAMRIMAAAKRTTVGPKAGR